MLSLPLSELESPNHHHPPFHTAKMPAATANSSKQLTNGFNDQAFENTSTSVAASQMRNALNNLADTVKDPKEKQVRHIQEHQRSSRH